MAHCAAPALPSRRLSATQRGNDDQTAMRFTAEEFCSPEPVEGLWPQFRPKKRAADLAIRGPNSFVLSSSKDYQSFEMVKVHSRSNGEKLRS
jgi:hypothetical protein